MTIPKRTEEVLQEHLEAKTALLGLDVTNHTNNMLEQWTNLTGAQHVPLYNKGKGNLGADDGKENISKPKSTEPVATKPMPPQTENAKFRVPSTVIPISVQQGPSGNAGTTQTPYVVPKGPVVPDTVPPEWAPLKEPALASKRANPLMQLVEKLESMICGCGQKAHSMFNNMPHCTPGEGCCSNSTQNSDNCGSCGDPSAAGTFHGMSICAPGQGCNKGFMGTGETLPEILKHNSEHDDWAAKTNHGQFAMPGESNKPEAPLGLAASKISTWITAHEHDGDDDDAGKSNEDEFGDPTYSDESVEDDFR